MSTKMAKRLSRVGNRDGGWLICVLVVLGLGGQPEVGWAEQSATQSATVKPVSGDTPTTKPFDETDLASPRATLRTFLLAMQNDNQEEAIACLDLSDIPADQQTRTGEERARLLNDLIHQRFPHGVKEETIPDDPDTVGSFALTETKDEQEREQAEIVLAVGADGLWRFASTTIALLPEAVKEASTTQPAAEAGVPTHLSSARATVQTFLEAVKESADNPDRLADAIECLDLSELASTIRKDQSRLNRLASMLWDVLNRTTEIILAEIPNDPAGPAVDLREGAAVSGSVIVHRVEDGRWLFSAKTVAELQDLYTKLRDTEELKVGTDAVVAAPELWLETRMPKWLRSDWLGLASWKWLGLGLLILVGIVLDQVVRWVLEVFLCGALRRYDVPLDEEQRRHALRPLGLLVLGFVWWKGLDFLMLPLTVDAILLAAAKVITAGAGVWAVYRLIDLLGDALAAGAAKTESKYDDLLVPLVRRSLKVGVTVVGLVFLSDAFDLEMRAILTSLGIGGLAIGFAARETLQNFFGSIVVLLDRPFHIGDWIKVGDIEGTVESVGFRTTRVRTFYNSLITMPNGMLLTAKVDNLGERRYRRIKAMLSLTYDTPPEKVEAFCEGIRALILQHPYTRKDYYHVYFNEFADSSLDILLYCFHETPDWGTELRERHRLFNDILRLAQRLGVSFAFPTQTIHLHQEADRAMSSPLPNDPFTAGREVASAIVRETGLAGRCPPPVRFGVPRSQNGGESDQNEDAG